MIAVMSDEPKTPRKPRGRQPDPESKRSTGQDRHSDPRFTFHLEAELLEALTNYCDSFAHDLQKSQVVRDALRDFLKGKGFFPPKKEDA